MHFRLGVSTLKPLASAFRAIIVVCCLLFVSGCVDPASKKKISIVADSVPVKQQSPVGIASSGSVKVDSSFVADGDGHFNGQGGWFIVGRTDDDEDRVMWAAIESRENGMEAAPLPGYFFKNLYSTKFYLVHACYASDTEARNAARKLFKNTGHISIVNSGPLRNPQPRVIGIEGTISMDGEPVPASVERLLSCPLRKNGLRDCQLTPKNNKFIFYVNCKGSIILRAHVPPELYMYKGEKDVRLMIDGSKAMIKNVHLNIIRDEHAIADENDVPADE